MSGSNGHIVSAIRGPLLLITLGSLVAMDYFGGYSFGRTWPVLLIVFGVLKLLEKLAPLNMRGLGIFEGGFRHFLSTKGMVQSPADMKGLKTRVAQSPLQIDIFRALGASPPRWPTGRFKRSCRPRPSTPWKSMSAPSTAKSFTRSENSLPSRGTTCGRASS